VTEGFGLREKIRVKRNGGFALQSIKIKHLFSSFFSIHFYLKNNPSVSLRSTPPMQGRQEKRAIKQVKKLE